MTVSFGKLDASYKAAGSIIGIQKLVTDFYIIMDELPDAKIIRDMHPENLDQSMDKLSRFLSGWLGGPRLYQEKYGSISIPGVHSHLTVGEAEKQVWMDCMKRAIDKQNYNQDFADYLIDQLSIPAERVKQVCSIKAEKNG